MFHYGTSWGGLFVFLLAFVLRIRLVCFMVRVRVRITV